MTIQNEHELETTRRKLTALEHQFVEANARLDAGTPLSEWTLRSLRKLIQQLQEEIIRFGYLMNNDVKFFADRGKVETAMVSEDITHIEIHRVLLVDRKVGSSIKEGKKRAAEVFMDAVETMKDMIEARQLDKKINMRKMNTTVQTMVDNILQNRDTYIGLTNLKMYDEYTFAHSVNTSLLASALGTFLHFEKPQVAALGVAGLLHDMGKASVPHEIVNKPGKLTDAEWAVLQRHPIAGALALADITGVTKMAMVAAFEHHQHGERGYPAVGVRQHLFSQIVSLADAYDAITAARLMQVVNQTGFKAAGFVRSPAG